MLPRTRPVTTGSLVPSSRSRVGFCAGAGCHIFGASSSWGRAGRAPQSPLDSGRSLIIMDFPSYPEFPRRRVCLPAKVVSEPLYHFDTSSLFPEARLR